MTSNADDIINFDLDQFVADHMVDIKLIVTPEVAKNLSDAISSPDARNFTEMMNKKFEENEDLDEDGNINKIETPLNLIGRMTLESDGNMSFTITPEEDRWFRADKLYGTNILGQLGLTYSVE